MRRESGSSTRSATASSASIRVQGRNRRASGCRLVRAGSCSARGALGSRATSPGPSPGSIRGRTRSRRRFRLRRARGTSPTAPAQSGRWAMRAEVRLAVLVTALLAVAGCGGNRSTLKVGVLTDCHGTFSAYSENALAAAQLPFLERGARLTGGAPSAGIAGARVGGVNVEVVTGCAEMTYLSQLIENVRRLIERDKVDVVVGPMLGETDGLVLRDLARRYPSVTFLLGDSKAQEATLHDPAPNVFRFTADEAQSTAGLGTYAFRRLGWRRAAVVVADTGQAWP